MLVIQHSNNLVRILCIAIHINSCSWFIFAKVDSLILSDWFKLASIIESTFLSVKGVILSAQFS